MKKIFTLLVLMSVSFISFSQKEKAGLIERNGRGVIASVSFREFEKSKAPRSANDFFQNYLEIKENDFFEKVPHKSKRPNIVHDHYDQYYKGVKVAGGGYNVHIKDGQVYFANGNVVKINDVNTVPSITKEEATNRFLKVKNIGKEKLISSSVELLVKEIESFSGNDTTVSVALVYQVSFEAEAENNDEIGFINAHTGELEFTLPRRTDLTGTFETRYSGSRQASTDPVTGGHRLQDNTRGATIRTLNMQNSTTLTFNSVELVDNDNNWTSAEHAGNNNDMGLDVHWALQQIYDYISTNRGVNSFNNNNLAINAYVRYGTNTDNASWDTSLNCLYFGQGASTFSPLASIDVVAHEYGHGLTQFQIGWVYSGDQAAFHEGMSDIWAAILENRIRPNSMWQIGEQVMANGKTSLRNIETTWDTNAHTNISNTFGSTDYNAGGTYERSGVLSHWFYILVNGKNGQNGVQNTYYVNGIGIDDAEELVAEAVFNNYLDNTTSYPAIRTAMLNAATDLFGSCSSQYIAVANAWSAVGVGNSLGNPLSGKYSVGAGATYYVSGSAGIGISSSSQSIMEVGNYGASNVYSWSVTSQNSGYAYTSFNGKSATMTLGPGSQRTLTCQVTTETCGTASISFSGYNFGSSFRVESYPNPAEETLTISLEPFTKEDVNEDVKNIPEQLKTGTVKLLNDAGLVLSTGEIKDRFCTLNVADIPSGRYFLHITTANEKVREQIEIRH